MRSETGHSVTIGIEKVITTAVLLGTLGIQNDLSGIAGIPLQPAQNKTKTKY